MKGLKYILVYLLVVIILPSCKEEEEPFNYGDFYYDMVTYVGDNSGKSVFTFQSYNDSPLITLTASNVSKPGMVKGQRLLLCPIQ